MKIKIILLFISVLVLVIIGCQKSSDIGTQDIDGQTTPTQVGDPPYAQMAIFGTLTKFEKVSSEKDGETVRLSISQKLRGCSKNISDIEIVSFFNKRHFGFKDVDFELDEEYHFVFTKEKEDDMWDGWVLTGGIQACVRRHNEDLTIYQKIQSVEGVYNETVPQQQRMVEIVPTALHINQPTQISIGLVNNQDNDIKFKILDLAIAEDRIAQPSSTLNYKLETPYKERLEKAIIKECDIDYNQKEQIIEANSNISLDFTVTCKESNLCQQYFEKEYCDINGGNCETTKLKHCERLYLAGQISFTDVLGFEHIIPPNLGILKQHLTIK